LLKSLNRVVKVSDDHTDIVYAEIAFVELLSAHINIPTYTFLSIFNFLASLYLKDSPVSGLILARDSGL
jgi:hypothetical protein